MNIELVVKQQRPGRYIAKARNTVSQELLFKLVLDDITVFTALVKGYRQSVKAEVSLVDPRNVLNENSN